MAVIYTDNFTDTNGTLIHNHTADTGQSYTTNTGMEIQNNRVLFTDVTTKIAKIESMTLATDYTIEIDFYKHTNAGNIGINFGVTSATATDVTYGIFFRVLSNGDLSLVRVNQFGAFPLWTWNPGVADGNALSTVKLEVTTGGGTGRGIRVFYGGVEQHFNESTVPAGDSLYIRSFTAASSTTGHHITRLEYNDEIPPPPSDAIPILTNPTSANITSTNVDVGFDTDQTDGTAYVLFNDNSGAPSAATVSSDGQVSTVISGSGTKSVSYTDTLGLHDGRNYFAHIMHNNSFGDSNVLSTGILAIPTFTKNYNDGTYALNASVTAQDDTTDTDTATLTVTRTAEVSTAGGGQVETGDTQTAGLEVPVVTAAAQTEPGDATASSVQVLLQVAGSQSEAGDLTVAAIDVPRNVASAQGEAGDSTVATVNAQPVSEVGSAQTEAGDTQASNIVVLNPRDVTSSQTEAGDVTAATVTVVPFRDVSAAQTEGGDVTAANVVVLNPRDVTASQTETGDVTAAAVGTQPARNVASAQTETGDTVAANVVVLPRRNVASAQTETGDTQAGSLQVLARRNVSAAQTEANETQSASIVEVIVATVTKHKMIAMVEDRIMLVSGGN